jgi:DNA topoisomerase-1
MRDRHHLRRGNLKAGLGVATNSEDELSRDPAVDAQSAGLRYVHDAEPGIKRQKQHGRFVYFNARGKRIRDAETLSRIRSLAIPPAWADVWICPSGNGHLQATGRDARHRKQYRYHARWSKVRDEAKYNKMIAFARSLPKVRRRVKRDLARRGLPRQKVLAAVVRLLETSLIRVGNDEYARANKSFGLTTMRNRHVHVSGAKIEFEFRGKSGVDHHIDLSDPRLARVVDACQDLPGQELFGYLDENGAACDIDSSDVNQYLQEIAGEPFTAKDFRTWAGTVLAARALREFEDFDSQAAAKRNIVQAIERVAASLGNTKSVCRKCYVHPEIIDAYLDRSLTQTLKARTEQRLRGSLNKLPAEEAAVLALLQQRLESEMNEKPRRRGNGRAKRKPGKRGSLPARRSRGR